MNERINPSEGFLDIFDISPEEREAILGHELPEDRQAALDALDILAVKLKTERLASIVRKPADAYGGLSIIEALSQHPQATLEAIQRSFDWSAGT